MARTMTRILVTGGAGLIGSHIVDLLLSSGYEVTILDNLEPEVHPEGAPDWLPKTARFVRGDVRDSLALDQALEGCTAVIHQAIYGGFSNDMGRMADVNCTGTVRLFEAVRRAGTVRRIVTASSMAVYEEGWYRCPDHGAYPGTSRPMGDREREVWEMRCRTCGAPSLAHPIPDGAPANPQTVYGGSKHFQERLTLGFGRELGIHAATLRYFLTFGPRQSVHNPYSGICSIFSTRILNNLPVTVYEDARQSRDIVYVADVARANLVALEDDRANGQAFNVATGTSTTIGDFVRWLGEAYGIAAEPDCRGRFRPMDTRHMLGDASGLRALGWQPEVNVRDGLRRYVAWIRSRGNNIKEYFTQAEQRLRDAGIVREVNRASE
jgi:dTDP-L-rhamnose 4-epimerase